MMKRSVAIDMTPYDMTRHDATRPTRKGREKKGEKEEREGEGKKEARDHLRNEQRSSRHRARVRWAT